MITLSRSLIMNLMNYFENKIKSVLVGACIFLVTPLFAFGQNAGGTPYFSDPVECASSFHLYDDVNLFQIVDGVVTDSYGSIPNDPTEEELTLTRDAIANGQYGCRQETVLIAGVSETVYVLDTSGLAEDSSLGDLSDQNKVCAATQSACEAQRAGWYPNASGCSTDSISGQICFYHLLEGTSSSTEGQMCGSFDEVSSQRTECFPSVELCTAGVELSADQSGQTLVSGCPTSEPSGTCDNVPTYCYTVQTFEIGQAPVCGTTYASDQDGAPTGGADSSDYARSVSACERQRSQYLPGENGSVPACVRTYHSGSPRSGTILSQMCSNVTGLVKKSDQQIADEEAIRLAELEAERLARLEAIRIRQQQTFDGTTFGGVEGTGKICGWIEFVQLANNVINFIIWAAAIIMVIVLLLAGFKLITAQGNASALSDAKKAMGKAILGFYIVLFAWLIVNAVMQSLLRDDFKQDEVVNLLDEQ